MVLGRFWRRFKLLRYLGFVFNSNGDYKDHIKELFKRSRLAANKV